MTKLMLKRTIGLVMVLATLLFILRQLVVVIGVPVEALCGGAAIAVGLGGGMALLTSHD